MDLKASLREHVARFNKTDNETYSQLIPNRDAADFLCENIPLLDCPDKDLEEIYYFRWWVYRKHIKKTEKGHIITEFLPDVPWAGPYNSINCPACYHIREGRWLKDQDQWIKEYIDFWLNEKGNTHFYSSWLIHTIWEYCTIKNDFSFAIERLPKLIRFYEKREKKHLRYSGLYWSSDNRDGMENSISGAGLRPTMNSYAYGDAIALAKIAGMAGETNIQITYMEKAKLLKYHVDSLLWDKDFYKVIPQQERENSILFRRPPVDPEHDVRELLGFLPWYFCMPDYGKEGAFAHLLSPDGFRAPVGLTTAEQRHPRFMEPKPYECWWNGPVWPFATSYVLVAIRNLLKEYHQNILNRDDYYRLLKQYAMSHKLVKEDGTDIPWIDENLHPFTGVWHARQTLQAWGWRKDLGGVERGKDYNHSLFCDLVLSGLLGIDVKNGAFICSPIIPNNWMYFRVENLWLNGKQYTISFDRTGTHYGQGKGLQITEITV